MEVLRTDEEIIDTNSAQSSLYTEKNSSRFIFLLPTETLEAIFLSCVRDYYGEDSGRPISTMPNWVSISYVCRHWRSVTLNYPTLWTYLFITSPRWTEELLARSKQASLKLHVDACFHNASPALRFLEQVIHHVERIQELRLHLSSRHCDEFISKLSARAPLLQNLEISTREPLRTEWSIAFFDGDTPTLCTLRLAECPIRWYSFKLNGLTTLILYRIPFGYEQNIQEFVATLSCMQYLEHLYLDEAISNSRGFLSTAAFRACQKVVLPHLSYLSITDVLSTVLAFLACVHVPLKTQVRLECYCEHDSSPNDYTQLSWLLAQRLGITEGQTPSSPTVRSLLVLSYDNFYVEGNLVISASECPLHPAVYPPYHRQWDCNIPLRVVVEPGCCVRGSVDRVLFDICCSFPLQDVQSVRVVGPPISSAFWSNLLGRLPNLRHLKLSEGYMPSDLAYALTRTPHYADTKNQDGYRSPDQLLVPALEELELDQILFSAVLPVERGVALPANAQSLYDALCNRKESRGRLTMVNCGLREDYKAKLNMVGRWEDGHFHIVEGGWST